MSITDPINRLFGSQSKPLGDADIVLGLPLETGSRTIYPVFREWTGDNSATPKQIGYLEVSEDRSDYTSLEPDLRPLAILPVALMIFAICVWVMRRSD
jgi:hypothetical protein